MARNILTSLTSSKAGNLYGYVLPKALCTITIHQAGQGYQLAEPEIELIPDPDHQYYFQYNPSIFSSDEIHINFSESGFLSSIRTSIDDQTGEFVAKLVDLGSALTEIISVPPTSTREVPAFRQKFDPFDKDQLSAVNLQLKQLDDSAPLSLEFKVLGQAARSQKNLREDQSGIYCKPMAMGELTLVQGDVSQSHIIRIPDPNNIHFIEIPQAAWVKTDFEVQFNEYGYPTSIHLNKPSSAMAFVEAPLKVVGAILELPTRLFRFQLDLGRRKEQALGEQVAMRESMNALQQRLIEMEEARQQERGLFSNWFGSNKKNQSSGSSNTGGQNTGGNSSNQGSNSGGGSFDPDIDNRVKKLQQDMQVMRKRMSKYEETLSSNEEG